MQGTKAKVETERQDRTGKVEGAGKKRASGSKTDARVVHGKRVRKSSTEREPNASYPNPTTGMPAARTEQMPPTADHRNATDAR